MPNSSLSTKIFDETEVLLKLKLITYLFFLLVRDSCDNDSLLLVLVAVLQAAFDLPAGL